MIRSKDFFLALLAMILAAGVPLYAQTDPAKGKDQKDEKKDAPESGMVSGELKLAAHSFKMTADQTYVIKVTAKFFQPLTQIRDKNLQTALFTNSNSTTFNGQEYIQQFS